MEISGSVAVITGAGSGIGRAMALAMASRGARIVAADIDDGAATRVAEEITAAGGEAVSIHCDVTEPSQVADAIALARSRFGRLDIVCNNAGVSSRTDLFEDDQGAWRSTIDINLTAMIEGTRQAVRALHELGGGIVVNTASMGGLLPMPDSPVYAASKAGVVNFTRSLAYLAEESNIRVNAICPSFVDTPLVRAGGEERMREVGERVGGILEADEVALGLIDLVEDDSQAGAIMRVTIRGGRDYAREVRP